MRRPVLNRRALGLAEVTVVALAAALFSAFSGPMFNDAREKARMTACCNNQRQIVLAVLVYCQDNDEVLPPSETVFRNLKLVGLPSATTLAALQGRMSVLTCPDAPRLANGYVYNNNLSAKSLADPNLGGMGARVDPTGIFVTADGQHTAPDGTLPNVAFTQADLDKLRHTQDGITPRFLASFLDGHVESLTGEALKWLPE
jgi:hypothetical protein